MHLTTAVLDKIIPHQNPARSESGNYQEMKVKENILRRRKKNAVSLGH